MGMEEGGYNTKGIENSLFLDRKGTHQNPRASWPLVLELLRATMS